MVIAPLPHQGGLSRLLIVQPQVAHIADALRELRIDCGEEILTDIGVKRQV